jgi:hypothetical protein
MNLSEIGVAGGAVSLKRKADELSNDHGPAASSAPRPAGFAGDASGANGHDGTATAGSMKIAGQTPAASPGMSPPAYPLATVDPTLSNSIRGIPPIHTACIDGNLRLVEFLVQTSPEDQVEMQDIVGSRPLHVAALYNYVPIIRYLIQCGADVNARDQYQSTPLVVTTNAEAVELLVAFGADVDAKNVNGVSARSIAATNPYVTLAIEQGMKQLDRRRFVTRQHILDATNQNRLDKDSITAASALTTLSTPMLGAALGPQLPSLSPLVGPAHSPSIRPKASNHHDESYEDKDDRFPISLANLIVSYLYPPAPQQPSHSPRMSFADHFN